jgi:hypothetical protein
MVNGTGDFSGKRDSAFTVASFSKPSRRFNVFVPAQ